MWLNILWPNVIVKSSISERRQWCFEQPGGLSSDSISFAAIISHKMKKWSSAEIWLLLKNHPQLWGLRLALPSICRLVCTIGKKGASHPIWPVPADHKLCRSRRHSIPYLMVNAPSAKYGYLLYPETARFKCHSAHHSSSVSSPSWN